MVSTLNLEEKFNRVRRNFCFYLDIQDHGLGRSLSRRLQDMGLQQEVFLTSRVTHVVRDVISNNDGASAAGARPRPNHAVAVLSVPKAISLLDKLYDTFFAAPRKSRVRYFNKHYIKIEFLDKVCRPVFKEFDAWPMISLEPDPPRREPRGRDRDRLPTNTNDISQNHNATGPQKMTRKSRPRIIDKEEKEPKGGYCEMCNADYTDAASHRVSSHHLAFVRDHNNFLALDTLIGAGADVETFLNKAVPINGERRSLRKMCNGDVDHTPTTRSKQHSPEGRHKAHSPANSPDSTLNGDSPKRNGKRDETYYKVVSTKLRSSGGFITKQKPQCNGNSNLVVKFKKVRRSELSVLSDEAEQFMFPKRASSTSSTSSDEDDHEPLAPRRKTPQPVTPVNDRQRLARPVALKEESSEEDTWPEDNRRKRRPAPVNKRGRRITLKKAEPKPETEMPPQAEPTPTEEVEAKTEPISPLREEPVEHVERCMKWEDGKLKYTLAVEQLEFAFESVPQAEPWYETFKRQDLDKVTTTNIPEKFALYTKSPKLPYEIDKLPPLKPNCCPLSDLVKRDDKAGPTRSYGTRGMTNQKQKFRKRNSVTNLIALEGLARKSPREHASTLAILGSAGLLNRRKNGADDTKSTASEETTSDTISNIKVEPVVSETQATKERLQQFLSEVFEDAEEYEVPEEAMEGEAAVTTSTNIPDMSSLMSECENCDLIRNEIKENQENRARSRHGKFKKKNRTGWPSKKKPKKDSRTNSEDSKVEGSLGRSSAEPPDEETRDTISEEELNTDTETEKTDKTLTEKVSEDESVKESQPPMSRKRKRTKTVSNSNSSNSIDEDSPEVTGRIKREKRTSRHSNSEEREARKLKRALACLQLQPVVQIARVDPNASRRLRSASKGRSSRLR